VLGDGVSFACDDFHVTPSIAAAATDRTCRLGVVAVRVRPRGSHRATEVLDSTRRAAMAAVAYSACCGDGTKERSDEAG
jgi:hypothetical protein